MHNLKPDLRWGLRTFVMGVINLTSDSFSGDGLLHAPNPLTAALEQAQQFVTAGVDILDIGGESTRPGSQPISAETEIERVLPIVRALRAEFPAVWLSVDTSKAKVAAAALAAGADMVNDVWAGQADPNMLPVVAEHGVPVVLMDNRSQAGAVDQHDQLGGLYRAEPSSDIVASVCAALAHAAQRALAAGVHPTAIILDPGIGFGKTVADNLALINGLDKIRALGYPVLLGTSRKGFIGHTLNLAPAERLMGTAATVAIGIARGADIVRVHDVQAMIEVARMTDALVRPNLPEKNKEYVK